MKLEIVTLLIARTGPTLASGVDELELLCQADFKVQYRRHGTTVTEVTQVTGAPGGGRWTFKPAGALHVWRTVPWTGNVRMHTTPVSAGAFARQAELDGDASWEEYESLKRATINTAKLALESCTDARVEWWGASSASSHLVTPGGDRVALLGARGDVEVCWGAELREEDAKQFAAVAGLLGKGPAFEKLLGAYEQTQRLRQAPEARVVFVWATLERAVKILLGREPKGHGEVLRVVKGECAQAAGAGPYAVADVVQAAEAAYAARNGLAHGDSADVEEIDFGALAFAMKVMLRRLAAVNTAP